MALNSIISVGCFPVASTDYRVGGAAPSARWPIPYMPHGHFLENSEKSVRRGTAGRRMHNAHSGSSGVRWGRRGRLLAPCVARGGDDRPPLPGACSDWPASPGGPGGKQPHPLYTVWGPLYGHVCDPLLAHRLRRSRPSALGTGRSLLRAVSLAGPPNRLPEGAGLARRLSEAPR